jgi:hypothetical protein
MAHLTIETTWCGDNNSICIPGSNKLDLAMQPIFTPIIPRLMERRRKAGKAGLCPELPGGKALLDRLLLSKAGPGALPLAEFEAEPQPCLLSGRTRHHRPSSTMTRRSRRATRGSAAACTLHDPVLLHL